jgi:predicted ATP-dependent endonuclease of OLD family
MAEKLIVKNFGPLKDIDIELKDVNIFIGPTSSGKSTLAKLVAIFEDLDFLYLIDFLRFDKFLTRYNLPFVIVENTVFQFTDEQKVIKFNKGLFRDTPNLGYNIEKKIFKDVSTLLEEIKTIKANKSFLDLSLDQLIFYLHQLKFETHLKLDKHEFDEIKNQIQNLRISKNFQFDDYNLLINKILKFLKSNNISHTTLKPIYIPAERSFIAMVANSILSVINNDVLLSKSFKEFGANFEKARNELKEFTVEMLAAQYRFENNTNKIYLENGEVLNLEQTSSGMQALLPMMLVVEYFANQIDSIGNYFIIEEPELNLYPTMQKALVEFLVEKCTKNNNKLIITTHSPYILTALDNLIQAKNVADEKPQLKDEVAKIVPEQQWLDFDRVSAYYVADGTAKSILDPEMRSIGANNIDDVSENLGSTFDPVIKPAFSGELSMCCKECMKALASGEKQCFSESTVAEENGKSLPL